MGATQTLARFASEQSPSSANTGRNTDAAMAALLDTVTVTIAGSHTPPARLVASWLDAEEHSDGSAAVWGTGALRSPAAAALLNGTAAHALDWDDAAPSMAMHPGAVLFPALAAQAARPGGSRASGAALVAAYDVGNAVFRAVTEALPERVHYGRGWHTTATVGRLAATAAAARLAGLDEAAARHALGLAASLAGGSLASFGTMTKPLHAGLAARDGVTAVALAERGFTASDEQLEHPKGFFALFGDGRHADGPGTGGTGADGTVKRPGPLADRLEYWARQWPTDWAVKRYPSCYATHRAIEAARWLRAEAGLPEVAEIARVRVTVRSGGLQPLLAHPPRTGLEAKFSMPYTVAVALRRGTVRLADFTETALADRVTGALMERIEVGEAAEVPGAEVQLTLRDGRCLVRGADIARGDARDPLTRTELSDKARDALASAGWSLGEAGALAAGLRAVAAAPDLDGLQELLRGPAASPEAGARRATALEGAIER